MKENYATKVTKIPKTKKTEIWDEQNKTKHINRQDKSHNAT